MAAFYGYVSLFFSGQSFYNYETSLSSPGLLFHIFDLCFITRDTIFKMGLNERIKNI